MNKQWFVEKKYSGLSKLKDLCNDVIVRIDNIKNVYFFICWQNNGSNMLNGSRHWV